MKYLIPLVLCMLALVPLVSSDQVTVSAEVSGYITVIFHYTSVNFGTLYVGTTNNPAPGNTQGAYYVTVDANANYKVEAEGIDFSGPTTLSISNLKLDTDPSVSGLSVNNAVSLSTSPQVIDTNIPYTVTTHYHGYWLTIPSGTPAGTYSTTVTITYSLV